MEQNASKTALFMAAYRARATERPQRLCNDPWARGLAGEDGARLATEYDRIFEHMELWTAVRTAFIDEVLGRSVGLGVRQIVLLGAGFDTRAVRLASEGVRFFEVDHPLTQADKRARVGSLVGYDADLATYVACDFESQDFMTQLGASGYDAARPALFIWEGVAPYLTEVAVRGTLRAIASRADAGSFVVFDHLRKKIVSGDVKDDADRASRSFVTDLGEPLRWGTDDVLPLLYEEGFRRVRTTSFDEACLDLTGTYERARKFRFQNMSVASRGARTLP